MNEKNKVINELFVTLFNDILQIDEKTLKNGPL